MAYVGPYNLIVSNGVLKNSSDVFNILDPDTDGAATFSVKLSANGLEPPTHWGCRTMLEEATYNALVNMTVQQFKAYVDQLSAQRGRAPVGSITAFKNDVQIDAGDFWAFVASLGLQLIQVPL